MTTHNRNGRFVGPFAPAFLSFLFSIVLLGPQSARAILIDQWRASDLTALDDGDLVGNWISASNRTVTSVSGLAPTLRKNVTPSGAPVVRFNRSFMTAGTSPFGGSAAFSIAVVFKATAAGSGADGSPWYQCSGLVDAEQGGVTIDWGTVFNGSGHVAIGTGNPDITTPCSGASLVDNDFHVAVFAWGGGSQSVYVDQRTPVTRTGVATAARMNAGFAFGGILTTEGGADRRFVGDVAEIRFYNTSLTGLEATNVIRDLTETYITADVPRIYSFASSTNKILIDSPVTLSWNVTNALWLQIDNGVGVLATNQGSVTLFPRTNTTYTLTATNAKALRSAQVAVQVDQGIPVASNQTVSVVRNTSVAIQFAGSDPQGSNLSYTLLSGPFHGALNGSLPNLTYSPVADYYGNDQITFKVNDGEFDSPPGVVTIEVVPPPMPPSAITLGSSNINAGAGPGSYIGTLVAVDPNLKDTHTFALVPEALDNALFSLDGNKLMAGPSFSADVGTTFAIQVTATDNTGLSLTMDLGLRVVEVSQNVVINEVHYNPLDNTSHEEFIELFNPTGQSVDLSLWRVSGGVDLLIPSGTFLASGGFLVLAENPSRILAKYGLQALGPWDGALAGEGETITLSDSNGKKISEVDYSSEFPWPIGANGSGGSMALVNPSLDLGLGSSWRTETPPSPGATNKVFALNAPPNIRQVHHTPQSPTSTNSIVFTAKVTDPNGVASVALKYQIVTPGNYLSAITPIDMSLLNPMVDTTLQPAANPEFEKAGNWIALPMLDDGLGNDEAAGDGIYTVSLPPQANRVLVRYRIVVTDTLGASRQAPFEDDPSLNFACFVYDGVPAYAGYSSAVMQSIPVYFLLTRAADFSACEGYTGTQLVQPNGAVANEGRFVFNWEGAFVYDGVVYDHVRYRLEGANGRYQTGRRNWAIKFNDGRFLAAKDMDGQPYPKKWSRINIAKGQSNRLTLTFSLNEFMTYLLCEKVGVPAPSTYYMHWRVLRTPQEQPDQYSGDFYGVYMVQENYDARFLDTHKMEKGNLYKLINLPRGLPAGGNADMVGQQRYQAANALTNGQDAVNAEAILLGATGRDSATLQAYVNYTKWDRYHAICEATRDYDFWADANKNAAWYFEPAYGASNNFSGRLWTLPWDATDTWGPTWNSGIDMCYYGLFNTTYAPDLQIGYFNNMREVRDLLIQPDQVNPMLDALAAKIRNIMPANLVRWSNSPTAGSSYSSMSLPGPGLSGGLAAYVQDMKDFMFVGGSRAWWIDRQTIASGGWATERLDARSADSSIPTKPTIVYAGPTNYPVTGLFFKSSAFADPQGAGTFAAMQWRVAEITPTNTIVSSPSELKWEIDPAWDSGKLTVFTNQIQVPAVCVRPGKVYRARVRHMDSTGRWSNWSAPVQFVPTAVDVLGDLVENLKITEIMYNPPSLGTNEADALEFLELKNTGLTTLDLSGLTFTAGITFTFANGTLLAPGQFFVLGRDAGLLQLKYPGLVVNGVYTGKLANGGETITLTHPYGTNILSVSFNDRAPWPVAADGYGFSLVPDESDPNAFRASSQAGGSPGADDPPSTIARIVVNEVLTSSVLPALDAVELYNPTAQDVDLSGWYLTDDAGYPWKYRIAPGTTLRAGCYLCFDESQLNPTPGVGTSFGLSSLGEEIYLFSANDTGTLTGYSHGFAFGGAKTGESFGRYINSVGAEQFPAQSSVTLGTNNAGPRVGPVVINEIHYHPPAGFDSFVELLNITGAPVRFYDSEYPTNAWKLTGLKLDFPTNVTIPAHGLMLVVQSDPELFRANYNVPAEVQIFGPTDGTLQAGGERLELQAPDVPSTNGVPYYVVDGVRYNDKSPWPALADGWGASLLRKVPIQYGDDPTNWLATLPTPGTMPTGEIPQIARQPVSTRVVETSNAFFSVLATGTGTVLYQWLFQDKPIEGATNATLELTNVNPTQAGSYRALAINVAGSVFSDVATLEVLKLPSIVTQPQTVSLTPNPATATNTTSNVVFSVTASGANLTYQWLFWGANLPGATNASLVVSNASLPNAGPYQVIVAGEVGSRSSQVAWLYVMTKPTIYVGIQAQSVVYGGTVTFSVWAGPSHPTLPLTYQWLRNGVAVLTNDQPTLLVSNVTASASWLVKVVNPAGAVNRTQVALTVLPDTDRDGLPDVTELAMGYPTNNPADGTLDFDADGMNNADEIVAGTSPTNASSVLRLVFPADAPVAGDQVRFSFDAVSNKTYSVEFKDALGAVQWNVLLNLDSLPTNRVIFLTNGLPQDVHSRFYRVKVPRNF